MDSRKVLIVTNKMSAVNNIRNYLLSVCESKDDVNIFTLPSGYIIDGIKYCDSCANITIVAVNDTDSNKFYGIKYDRVIIDNSFNYNGGEAIVKAFEKCCKNAYDVVDIELSRITAM